MQRAYYNIWFCLAQLLAQLLVKVPGLAEHNLKHDVNYTAKLVVRFLHKVTHAKNALT